MTTRPLANPKYGSTRRCRPGNLRIVSTATKFFLLATGGSLLLYVTALGSNEGVSKFATEYRTEQRRLFGAVLVVSIVGLVISALLA